VSPRARAWALAGVAVVAVFVVLGLVSQALAPAPQGPPGSAYATTARGAAAWAQLLTRDGHPTSELRTALDRSHPDPDTTLVVLGASALARPTRARLRRFVAAGGHLVIGGGAPAAVLSDVAGAAPVWHDRGPRTASVVAPVPETRGVSTVRAAGDGAFAGGAGGSATAVLTGRGGALMVVRTLGRGRIAVLADPTPVENAGLGLADNARLALDLAGPAGRPVVFAEALHGYTRATGLAAFPARWWVTIAGLALAAGAWALSRGRRLGPPQRPDPVPVPPRAAYVEALARRLAAGRSRDALRRYATGQPPDGAGDDDAGAGDRDRGEDADARALHAGP
jgi:hypothetical protein